MKVLAVLESTYGSMNTRTCSTPSGGRHLYFKHPGGPLPHKEILPGVELIAEAKLMAPPSIVDGKPYEWVDESAPVSPCPPWLVDLLAWTTDGILCKVVNLMSAHWSEVSSRQHACLALSGYLARRAWPLGKAVLAIRLIHALGHDDINDLDKRLGAAKDTYAKFEANKTKSPEQCEPLTGLPEIGNAFGEAVASELGKLVGTDEFPSTGHHADAEIEKLNQEYAVVHAGSSVVVLRETVDSSTKEPTLQLMRVGDFRLWLKNRMLDGKPLADVWLKGSNRRQYDGIVFSPGEPTPGLYNLWRGFHVKGGNGDCSRFLKHIEEVICRGNKAVAEYVLNWCAHLVQRPAELPEVAVVLRGLQGTGKGMFARALGKLVGSAHFAHLTSINQIVGRFNAHLAGKLLVFADEALWGGNKHSEGALKALITEPTISIEQKGKDIFHVRNYTRLIVASNANWAVPLDLDDRRFLVLDVSEAHKEDTAYFSALQAELDNGGLSGLMQYLQQKNLSSFNVRAMPKTSSAFDIKLKSASTVCRWWYQMLRDAEASLWLPTVKKKDLHAKYLAWCKDLHEQHPESQETFSTELRKLVPNLKDYRPNKAEWNGERPRCFKFPALADCRALLQVSCKCGSEIWAG